MTGPTGVFWTTFTLYLGSCLLYTSDAADDLLCVDLGGRRIIKKKTNTHRYEYNENTHIKRDYERESNVELHTK